MATDPSLLAARQHEIENDPNVSLTIPGKLTTPHPLILKAKENLAERQRERFYFHGMIQTERGILEMNIGLDNVSKALRFMDTLIKNLYSRNHTVIQRYEKTYVIILGQEIQIGIREKTKRIESKEPYGSSELYPTGILVFKMHHYSHLKEFNDAKVSFQDQLSRILAELELLGEFLKAQSDHFTKARERREIEEKKNQAILERQSKELKDFKLLIQKAARWQQASMLRLYINDVEEKSKQNPVRNPDTTDWAEWARKKADWYDPNIEAEDDLLTNVDKDTLSMAKKFGFA